MADQLGQGPRRRLKRMFQLPPIQPRLTRGSSHGQAYTYSYMYVKGAEPQPSLHDLRHRLRNTGGRQRGWAKFNPPYGALRGQLGAVQPRR